MLKKIIRWRPFSMSRNQAEYIWLILLASLVGVLAAFGNLMLREAIRFFMWLFQVVEWNALQIPRGIPFSLLIPLVLVSGGLVIMLLEVLLPGDVMGYGFPYFLEKIHLGDARLRTNWIFAKAVGPAMSLGAGASVGREGPIAQIGGAIGSVVARLARLSTERSKVLVACGAGTGNRDDLQCADRRTHVRPGDCPARSNRTGQSFLAGDFRLGRSDSLARHARRPGGAPGPAIHHEKLLGVSDPTLFWDC